MSFIPDEIISRVREATDIVGVVGQFVTLRKSGRNYLGLCPFHSEKTPSFTVNPQKQIFHCFGCGEGGNVYTFLMKVEGKAFPEAVRDLARRAGVEVPADHDDPGRAARADDRDRVHEVNKAAAEFFTDVLVKHTAGRVGLEYLNRREIGREMIDKHRIGYAPGAGAALRDHLNRKGYKDELLDTAGLVGRREQGGFIDRFRSRVMFPIITSGGHVCAFGGRTVESSADTPKYLNSPETPAYNKSSVLYGIHAARESLRRSGFVLLVEGYLDLVMLDQAGFGNVVATCGTALTQGHVETIRRFTKGLHLCFDGDAAGRKAVLRAAEVLLGGDLKVKVVSLPPDDDPDSFIKRYGPEAFNVRIRQALPLTEFIIDHFAPGAGGSIQDRSAAFEETARFIARISGEIERTLYTRRVAERFGIDEQMARARIEKTAGRGAAVPGTEAEQPKRAARRTPKSELLLVAAALRDPRLFEGRDVEEVAGKMSDAELAALLRNLVERGLNGAQVAAAAALDMVSSTELRAALSGLALDDELIKAGSGARIVDDCVARIRHDWVATSLKLVDAEIRRMQETGETTGLPTLLKRKMDLAREIKSGRVVP